LTEGKDGRGKRKGLGISFVDRGRIRLKGAAFWFLEFLEAFFKKGSNFSLLLGGR
jgi:hypothetical protein